MNNLTSLQPQHHIQEIDGLRGIAISSVVLLHWIILPLSPIFDELGIKEQLNIFAYGVDLFFVISGFLIGGILLKAGKQASSMAIFYFKRIMRIWPIYYLLLGIIFYLGGGISVFGDIPYWSFFLFIFNFWESVGLNLHPAFGPLWSLAIEEQFYLVGPLLFFLLEKRKLMYLTAAWFIISPFLRLTLMLHTELDTWRFTPVRLDGICTGIFLAILVSSQGTIPFLLTNIKPLKTLTVTSIVISLICKVVLPNHLWYAFGNSLMVLSFGLLLITVLAQCWSNQKNRILNSVVLRYLGLRCYNIYLFHIFFMMLASGLVENFFVQLVIQALLTLGFAHISWKYIEYPLIRFARKFPY